MAGIHLVVRLSSALDETRVVAAARDISVGLYGIRAFYAGPAAGQGVLLGYGGTRLDTIERGLPRLAALMLTLV